MGGGDSAGGSNGLAKLIDQYGEQLNADFQSFYFLDFVKVMTPGSGYSPRRVLSMIRQLPPESRTVAALRGGDQFYGWGVDRYLLAAQVDAIRENTHAFISANSPKKRPKPPEPVARPSKDSGPPKDSSSNPFRQQLAARKGQGG